MRALSGATVATYLLFRTTQELLYKLRRARCDATARKCTNQMFAILLLPTSFVPLPPANSVAAARRHSVPRAAESPPPFTITRKGLYRLAVGTGYASLLLAVSKAEEDPVYQARVARTISSAVPSPNLRVLEIGIGRAANLDAYPQGTELVGLDASLPAEAQRAGIVARARGLGLTLRFVEGDATALPFDAGAFDAVVMTKVLCSVSDPAAALREVSRVLAPGGRFGFVEHVAADRGSGLEAQQLLLDPLQQVLAGGCHLHRETDTLVSAATSTLSGGGGGGGKDVALFARELVPPERYLVWRMWPIVQQVAGVVVR